MRLILSLIRRVGRDALRRKWAARDKIERENYLWSESLAGPDNTITERYRQLIVSQDKQRDDLDKINLAYNRQIIELEENYNRRMAEVRDETHRIRDSSKGLR